MNNKITKADADFAAKILNFVNQIDETELNDHSKGLLQKLREIKEDAFFTNSDIHNKKSDYKIHMSRTLKKYIISYQPKKPD